MESSLQGEQGLQLLLGKIAKLIPNEQSAMEFCNAQQVQFTKYYVTKQELSDLVTQLFQLIEIEVNLLWNNMQKLETFSILAFLTYLDLQRADIAKRKQFPISGNSEANQKVLENLLVYAKDLDKSQENTVDYYKTRGIYPTLIFTKKAFSSQFVKEIQEYTKQEAHKIYQNLGSELREKYEGEEHFSSEFFKESTNWTIRQADALYDSLLIREKGVYFYHYLTCLDSYRVKIVV